jgi:hypothetical protein
MSEMAWLRQLFSCHAEVAGIAGVAGSAEERQRASVIVPTGAFDLGETESTL